MDLVEGLLSYQTRVIIKSSESQIGLDLPNVRQGIHLVPVNITKHISPYSGQIPSSIWAAFSELCIHLEMLSYENKFCNFYTSEKEKHHKDDSSKKNELFGLKTLF